MAEGNTETQMPGDVLWDSIKKFHTAQDLLREARALQGSDGGLGGPILVDLDKYRTDLESARATLVQAFEMALGYVPVELRRSDKQSTTEARGS